MKKTTLTVKYYLLGGGIITDHEEVELDEFTNPVTELRKGIELALKEEKFIITESTVIRVEHISGVDIIRKPIVSMTKKNIHHDK